MSRRTIKATFLIVFEDPRPDVEREPTDQLVDAIAYGIDTHIMDDPRIRYTEPTQIVSMEEVRE